MSTMTDKQATVHHLISALYAAKAEFKAAASAVATAEHEVKSLDADASAYFGDCRDARIVLANAKNDYFEAETAYQAIYRVCRKLAIVN